ncbi:hypothetical protein ACQP00_26830 [Dactylosporangium sp. CS-047395]|uniref:hypothetical protein n=1 Tax=Dactylosporangium sp. CS-047395 TaxID=3239936 RepID=UPI003D943BDA
MVRLAWHWPGDPVEHNAGPVHLVFDDGRGLVLDGRSDWTLRLTETEPGDDSWLRMYDYDFDGGRWLPRDATSEPPFAAVVTRTLDGAEQLRNQFGELDGLRLHFGGRTVTLRTVEGEITT